MPHTAIRRMTKQRKLIKESVKHLVCHPTAEQIFDDVREKLPGTSLSTVYRNLGILVDQGDILAVRGPGKEVHYDHNTHEHCHMMCSICGNVYDVDVDPVDLTGVKPEDINGFSIDGVHVCFTGVCSKCMDILKKEDGNAENI